MNNKLKTAFTLIELLVVIAIVGILSGLIIVGMGSATQSATVAKAQIFSTSLRNSLALNLVAEWKLDEVNVPNAGQTPDNWTGAYYGTLQGAGGTNNLPQISTDCVYGNCLNFDGTDDRILITNNANFNMTSGITVEAWIKPSRLDVTYQGILVKGMASYGYHFMTYQTTLNPYARIGGVWTNMNSLGPISLNKWNYVAWTYNGTNSTAYINSQKSTTSKTGAISYESDDNLYIASGKYGVVYFNGSIDGVRLYNATIPASRIKENYYAGLANLLSAGDIDENEYRLRVSELMDALAEK